MKKIWNLWLMAALVCGLGLNVTACSDDDDDNKSEEQKAEEQAEKASKFWSVVGQLVSSDDYTDDYADKTFEPVYGIADAANETTRIVETNDMQTAASRFADLVSVGDGSAVAIDENTPSYTYNDPEVGTLTYTRGGTANEWATVDVNIKQLPTLRKIIYREGGEGTNANFAGKAYYRFGDVVSRTNSDGQTEYWICVRPAFGPEKKSDSHWVCLNTVPTKNQYHVSGSNGTEYYVPKGVNTDKENMQNLAEMLYAIAFPQQWYDNANNYHTDGRLWGFSGMPIFKDFKKANVIYHNQHFWQKVNDGWMKHQIADKAMNVDLGALADRIHREGINLLFEGYSWWSSTSWNCTLHQASYTNGTSNDEKNLHHADYKDLKKNMKDLQFDCREMGSKTANYIKFFDNDGKYRWVVRHATGEKLNDGHELSPTAPIQGAGVKTVYRYYDEYESEWVKKGPNGQSGHPEVTEDPNIVANAPDNLTGVFQVGDVLECVEDGTKWFCMLGKPESTTLPFKDQEATFISLDIPSFNGVKAQGLMTEAELPEYAFRFLTFLHNLQNTITTYRINLWPNGQQGKIGEHIKKYTGIDLKDLVLCVDSVWRFKDNNSKYFDSRSASLVTNFAYDDGSDNHQAVARILEDMTQAGSKRSDCSGTTADGKTWQFKDWHFYVYKHYEYFDASRQSPFPTGWNEAGGTAWQWLWPVSDTRITLQDLTNQDLVARYAAADKWVRLPLMTDQNASGDRRSPRTQAETSVSPSDFFYKNGQFATTKRSMWNEPVLFLRVAKIVDKGHRQLNLKSTDGRRFKVVHMQVDPELYSQNFSSIWAINGTIDRESGFYLDNKLTPLPAFEM